MKLLRRAATKIEYGLLISLVVLAILGYVTSLGGDINTILHDVCDTLSEAAGESEECRTVSTVPPVVPGEPQPRLEDPFIASFSVPPDGSYADGGLLTFVITFNEPVYYTAGGHPPQLRLGIGPNATAREEVVMTDDVLPGEAITSMRVSYPVVISDSDDDGVELLSTVLEIAEDGSIVSAETGRRADLTLPTTPMDVTLEQTAAARLVGWDVSPAGTYKYGDELVFVAKFNRDIQLWQDWTWPDGRVFTRMLLQMEVPRYNQDGVLVDTVTVDLQFAPDWNDADYPSFSEARFVWDTETSSFGWQDYGSNHSNPDGVRTMRWGGQYNEVAWDRLITDPAEWVHEPTSQGPVDFTAGFPDLSGLLFDNTRPRIIGLSGPDADVTYRGGDRLEWTATFSEPITLLDGEAPFVPLLISNSTRTRKFSSSDAQLSAGGTVMTFSYTVDSSDFGDLNKNNDYRFSSNGLDCPYWTSTNSIYYARGRFVCADPSKVTDSAGNQADLAVDKPGADGGQYSDDIPGNAEPPGVKVVGSDPLFIAQRTQNSNSAVTIDGEQWVGAGVPTLPDSCCANQFGYMSEAGDDGVIVATGAVLAYNDSGMEWTRAYWNTEQEGVYDEEDAYDDWKRNRGIFSGAYASETDCEAATGVDCEWDSYYYAWRPPTPTIARCHSGSAIYYSGSMLVANSNGLCSRSLSPTDTWSIDETSTFAGSSRLVKAGGTLWSIGSHRSDNSISTGGSAILRAGGNGRNSSNWTRINHNYLEPWGLAGADGWSFSSRANDPVQGTRRTQISWSYTYPNFTAMALGGGTGLLLPSNKPRYFTFDGGGTMTESLGIVFYDSPYPTPDGSRKVIQGFIDVAYGDGVFIVLARGQQEQSCFCNDDVIFRVNAGSLTAGSLSGSVYPGQGADPFAGANTGGNASTGNGNLEGNLCQLIYGPADAVTDHASYPCTDDEGNLIPAEEDDFVEEYQAYLDSQTQDSGWTQVSDSSFLWDVGGGNVVAYAPDEMTGVAYADGVFMISHKHGTYRSNDGGLTWIHTARNDMGLGGSYGSVNNVVAP